MITIFDIGEFNSRIKEIISNGVVDESYSLQNNDREIKEFIVHSICYFFSINGFTIVNWVPLERYQYFYGQFSNLTHHYLYEYFTKRGLSMSPKQTHSLMSILLNGNTLIISQEFLSE